ncbi:acyltransferase [Serratia sp. M24T3]|uniref:acyltransferase family protein n=1 Tax=Serratia sp. M24T3 TaxID=932213 RepID=UPI001ED934EC|nr:acyltransferase [Serratia sp. M24T3]
MKSNALHDNCFDVLRHLAALMVIFDHHHSLSGGVEPEFFGLTSLGSIAVYMFFSISGYLITQSFERRKSNIEYAKKRFFRIYPGLVICLIFTVYICCGMFGRLGFSDWATSLEPVKTFFKVLCITGYGTVYLSSHGMNYFTTDYIFKDTMNGSLWTLFFEILEYIMIALFLSVFRNKSLAIAIPLFLAIALLIYCNAVSVAHMKLISLGFLTIPFCMGALLYLNRDKWLSSRSMKLMMFIFPWIMFYLSSFSPLFSDALISMAVCLLTIVIGLTFKDPLIKGRFDFSYGIYIYAFPVQQIVINELGMGFYTSMLLSISITFVLAVISWFFIEKPAIEWSRRVIKRPESVIPADRTLD